MSDDKFDAIVVGAGVAGSVAALVMARAGLDVLIIAAGQGKEVIKTLFNELSVILPQSKIVNTVRKSFTEICPGADAFFTAPKVAAEPNTSPARREITPVFAIDIVIIGRSAYCSCISRVAASNVSTSLVLCGISAILGISASKDCILRRRAMISSASGVLWKSWLDMTTFTSCAWA
jgi:hypothetical protein